MVCLRNMCMATLNKGDNDIIIIIIINVKLENKHWYNFVTKSVERSHEVR